MRLCFLTHALLLPPSTMTRLMLSRMMQPMLLLLLLLPLCRPLASCNQRLLHSLDCLLECLLLQVAVIT